MHRYVSLVAAILLVIVGVSGSMLVYRDEIDDLLQPELYRVASSALAIDADGAVDAARDADPAGVVRGVEIPHASGNPKTRTYNVLVERGGATDYVTIDPSTGRVLALLRPHQRFTDWVYDVHTALLLAASGRNVVGTAGLVMLASAFSGLALWPGWKRPRAGFSFKRGASTRRTSYDVHKLTGIVSFGFLILLGSTGSLMTWYGSVDAGITRLAGTKFESPPVANFERHRLLSLTQLITAGNRALPHSIATYVAVPVIGKAVYEARAMQDDFDQTFGFRTLYLEPATGRLVRSSGGLRDPLSNWYSVVYALHAGNLYSHPAYRIAIFIVGLLPLV